MTPHKHSSLLATESGPKESKNLLFPLHTIFHQYRKQMNSTVREKLCSEEEEKTFLQALPSHPKSCVSGVKTAWMGLFYGPGDEWGGRGGGSSPRFLLGYQTSSVVSQYMTSQRRLKGFWVTDPLSSSTLEDVSGSRSFSTVDKASQKSRAALINQHLILWISNRVKLDGQTRTKRTPNPALNIFKKGATLDLISGQRSSH